MKATSLFIATLIFLKTPCAAQSINNSINTGIQAGRDVNITKSYYYGQTDNDIIALGFSVVNANKKSANENIVQYSDSLFSYCQELLKNPKNKQSREQVHHLIIKIASFDNVQNNLSDKELNIYGFIKESNENKAEINLGGTCKPYSYKKYSFQSGNNFIRITYPFKQGYARIAIIPKDPKQPVKYGMINRSELEIIPAIFDTVFDLSEGVILTRTGKFNYVFYDTLGNDLNLDLSDYVEVNPFSCGYARVKKLHDGYIFIDKMGNKLLGGNRKPLQAMDISPPLGDIKFNYFNFGNGYYKIAKKKSEVFAEKVSGELGSGFNDCGYATTYEGYIIDTLFRKVTNGKYYNTKKYANYFTYGFGPFGLLDCKGRDLSNGIKYSNIHATQYNYWIVANRDNEFTVLNKRGHELFPFGKYEIEILSDNLIKVYDLTDNETLFFTIDEFGNSVNADDCN